MKHTIQMMALTAAAVFSGRRVAVGAFSTARSFVGRSVASSSTLSSPTRFMSTTAASTDIIPRIKTVDATEPSDGPVVVKGWVRTIRKQKTLAFLEVNDGSNLGGIQCVLSYDNMDEASKEGEMCWLFTRGGNGWVGETALLPVSFVGLITEEDMSCLPSFISSLIHSFVPHNCLFGPTLYMDVHHYDTVVTSILYNDIPISIYAHVHVLFLQKLPKSTRVAPSW